MSKIDFIEYMISYLFDVHIIIVLENIFIPQLFVCFFVFYQMGS